VKSHRTLNGVEEFTRVVSDPIFEDKLDVFNVRAWISIDHNEICYFSGLLAARQGRTLTFQDRKKTMKTEICDFKWGGIGDCGRICRRKPADLNDRQVE
jgi:hypothetical protein